MALNVDVLEAGQSPASGLMGAPERLSDAEVSRTINCARVVLMTALVFVHYEYFPNSNVYPTQGIDLGLHPLATFINSFFYFSASALIALLSLISGWLFFALKGDPLVHMKHRIRTRLQTLCVPMIAWCSLYLVVLGTVYWWNPQNALIDQFTFDFAKATPLDYVNAVLGISKYPIDYPFWFMHDLLIAIMLGPVLWHCLQRAPYLGAAVAAVIWLGNFRLGIFHQPIVISFFYFGGLLQLKRVPLDVGPRTTLVCVALTFGFVLMRDLAPLYLPASLSYDHFPLTIVVRLFRLISVVACWGLFVRLARTPIGAAIAPYGGPTIFLFAGHALVLAEVKILLWPLMPAATDGWMIVHYFASIILTIVLLFGTAMLLARYMPGTFAFLTGGRDGRRAVKT